MVTKRQNVSAGVHYMFKACIINTIFVSGQQQDVSGSRITKHIFDQTTGQ
jgi:hypothetical protein